MSYRLNKTDGSLLVDLIDGTVDTDTTNLTLIGRNYSGFGEFLNENFIKLLENFSSTSAPTTPVTGQLWYDSSESRLKIYNGTNFIVTGAPFVQKDQPQMIAGDLWINNYTNQIYFFDGTDLVLVGPVYSAQQGKSGFEVSDIEDTQDKTRRILKLYISDQLVAVISNLTFTAAPQNKISEIDAEIRKGITLVDEEQFRFYGTSEYALNLITDEGVIINPNTFTNDFVRTDSNGVISGSLTIQNNNGIIIGLNQSHAVKIQANTVVAENLIRDNNYSIKIKSSENGTILNPSAIDAFTVRSINKSIGIFNNNPQYSLDVNGDCRVSGNLIVDGDTTYINVSNLQVEDKNIELLGTSADDGNAVFLNRNQLDDAGVIIKSQEGDIKFTYQNANDSWTSSDHLNLASTKTFKINGSTVLTETSLGPNVTSSSLTSVGTLTSLDVGQLNITGSTITSTQPIDINNQQLTGLAAPVNGTDAVNKIYADELTVNFSLDITGLNNNQIALVINDLYPAANRADGTVARVHTVNYTVRDFTTLLSKSLVAVDSGGGTNNESVLQDVTVSGNPELVATRGLKQFVISGGSWTFDTDLASSV